MACLSHLKIAEKEIHLARSSSTRQALSVRRGPGGSCPFLYAASAGTCATIALLLLGCGSPTADDNGGVVCSTDPRYSDPATASALTVNVDDEVANGTPTTAGGCTALQCSDAGDAGVGKCTEWKGQMTAISPSDKCTVTFRYADGTETSASVFGGNICGDLPTPRTFHVTATAIKED